VEAFIFDSTVYKKTAEWPLMIILLNKEILESLI